MRQPYRLAVLATHPIQYQAPWFRALHAHPEIDLQIFFCHHATAKEQSAAGFGVEFEWDVPLLEGYPHRFLKNVAQNPTTETFNGLDTPEIKTIIAREKFDAVLVSGWNFKSAWQAMRACWKTGTPVMARGDSHLHTPRHPLKAALKYPFYRWFLSKFDACLAVGEWSREYYRHYGARPERIFFVPHVIDDEFFARESRRLLPQRSALRRQWNLQDDAVVFIFVGKFIDKKRPMDFVKAIALAAQQNSSVMGLMVGDGALRDGCEQLVRQKNLPIKFTGFLNQSQIIESFIAADALILPSDGGETWGLVVNEAMACGCACIVSDQVGCGPDLIEADQTGAIVPMGDVNLLAQVLAECAQDAAHLKRIGENARQRVSTQYSMQVVVDGMLEALRFVQKT